MSQDLCSLVCKCTQGPSFSELLEKGITDGKGSDPHGVEKSPGNEDVRVEGQIKGKIFREFLTRNSVLTA